MNTRYMGQVLRIKQSIVRFWIFVFFNLIQAVFASSVSATGNINDCMVSSKILSMTDYTVVDVRPSRDFARYRISGAINLPLYQIHQKTYLREHHLLLVNDGKGEKTLLETCRELRQSGFKSVHVLKGGLNTWRKRVGTLSGSQVHQSELSVLQTDELYNLRNEVDWTLVDINAGKSDEVIAPPVFDGHIFKNRLKLKSTLSGKTLFRHLKKQLYQNNKKSANNNTDFNSRLIIVGQDTSQVKALLHHARQDKDFTQRYFLFELKDDLSAYAHYLKRQLAMRNKKVFSLQKSASCQ